MTDEGVALKRHRQKAARQVISGPALDAVRGPG
jgi:hypothetical protein